MWPELTGLKYSNSLLSWPVTDMILELQMREIGNLATHSKTTKDVKTLEKKKFVSADDYLLEVALAVD